MLCGDEVVPATRLLCNNDPGRRKEQVATGQPDDYQNPPYEHVSTSDQTSSRTSQTITAPVGVPLTATSAGPAPT